MRLQKLELIRYGKFTDIPIQFPKAEKDFHLIVGPNEAGKSTIRTAIAELLFGMPRSSPLGFFHPQSELRLGAAIENEASQLVFHRTKAAKQSLRSPSDSALPDDAMAPFIGTADKAFFEQMFGLDHSQLIKGGQNILDASKDVGQVLFQSAAGIASLGRVRDALTEEADKLWAPRKSGDRAYYIGLQRFEEASAELKESAVRTKAWSLAHLDLNEAEERLRTAQERHQTLETNRHRLERVRRAAPYLATLRAKEAELRELGEVVDLPFDAGSQLSVGQAEQSAAEQILRLREADVTRLQGEIGQVNVDDASLAFKKDIQALEATGHRCRDHCQDLLLRDKEVNALLEEVKTASAQLGWLQDEKSVRALLPSSLALRTVSNLVRDRGAFQQAATSDARVVQKKLEEISRIESQLKAIPVTEVSAELKTTLSSAQTLRHTTNKQHSLSEAVQGVERDLEAALQALEPWRQPPEQLKAMAIPSEERLAQLKTERQTQVSACRSAQERLEEAQGRSRTTVLEVQQYSQTHRVVAASEVKNARSDRDAVWTAVKSGEVPLKAGVPAVDAAIQHADELVDVQLGSVTESTELQSLQQRLERENADVERLQEMLQRRKGELAVCDETWAGKASEIGVGGLLLDEVASWLNRRELAISAAAFLDSKKHELTSEERMADQAYEQLRSALEQAGVSVAKGTSLGALCSTAEAQVSGAEATAAQRNSLTQQLDQSNADYADLRLTAAESEESYQRWQREWEAALSQARLGSGTGSVATVEAAVELVSGIYDKLTKVSDIRRERIDTMRADLERFSLDAQRLAQELDEALLGVDSAEVSKELSRRLAAATTAKQDAERIRRELETAREKIKEAQERVESAAARLQPLFRLGAVETSEALQPLIERSDKKRGLLLAIETAQESLSAGGDGLSLIEIAAEVDATDVTSLHAILEQVNSSLSESVKKQSGLATERATAELALSAISGRANAAIAEAKRQEAIAMMADASERYIKVATAAKLLRWAIDRYRDRKQGPMLSRAGAIFSQLTIGGFKKLVVDYEKAPLTLAAIRTEGQVVEISGMSEGTRDQLFLALRLAALELHLGQATALPFIADDLFVNFDDERAKAGLSALAELSKQTQVIFLSHHDHLVPIVQEVLGPSVNIIRM